MFDTLGYCVIWIQNDASFKYDQITNDVFVLFYFALFWYKNGKNQTRHSRSLKESQVTVRIPCCENTVN